MSRPNWLKNAIAKNDGYYGPKGEKLKAVRLTDAQCAAFNGKQEAKPKAEPKPEPVVETVVVEEVAQAGVAEEIVTLELETAAPVVEEETVDLEAVAEEVVEEAPAVKSAAPKKGNGRKKGFGAKVKKAVDNLRD